MVTVDLKYFNEYGACQIPLGVEDGIIDEDKLREVLNDPEQ